jgi:para-aminobenzoate synthetase component 1
LSEIRREGFAMLHGKWGGRNEVQSIVGVNGKCAPKIPRVPSPPIAVRRAGRDDKRAHYLGFLAYPNPTLKNNIPDTRFYGYDSLACNFVIPTVVEGFKIARFSTSGRLEQSVTKKEYINKILKIKELLSAGEIYQLDYAIRFRKKFEGEPFALFLKLIEVNPTDFSAYLNCGGFQIISNSPERLFKVENDIITTQPIKGTAPKSGGHKEFKRLINSEKERAELDMITDLERNDVGKICEYGTLKLAKEREAMELQNLWHTYSEVRGKLRPDVGLDKIISAMFPGGSITGCPKKRAMEYIELLEGMPRNIFTGSIGYISNGKMDFNIAIRTALVRNSYIEYWAGGGIVADSDPAKEYEECLLKAEKFLQLL